MTEIQFYDFWTWQWYRPIVGMVLLCFVVVMMTIFWQDLLHVPQRVLRQMEAFLGKRRGRAWRI